MKAFGKKILACAVAMTAAVVFLAAPVCADWQFNDNGWQYQSEDGSFLKDEFSQIDGNTYFFDNSGYMKTGWQKMEDKWYYFDESGAMSTGWRWIDGDWYYLDPATGIMQTGLVFVGSSLYYLDASGKMQTGKVQIDGGTLTFGSDGRLIAADYDLSREQAYQYALPEGWLGIQSGPIKILYPVTENSPGTNVILADMAREENYGGYDTLEAFSEATKLQIKKQIQKMFPTASELKLSDRRVYGLSGEAIRFVLTYQVGDLNLKQEETVIFLSNRIVSITYSARAEDFERFSDAVDEIVSSVNEF